MLSYKHSEEIPLIQSINMSLLGKTGAVFSDNKECLLELQESGSSFKNIIARVRFCLEVGERGVERAGSTLATPAVIFFLFISIG